MFKAWKSFKEEYPKDQYLVLMTIEPKREVDPLDHIVNNKLYLGYRYNKTIFVIAELDNMKTNGMSWKVSKDFNDDEIFWYYDYTFLAENIPQ